MALTIWIPIYFQQGQCVGLYGSTWGYVWGYKALYGAVWDYRGYMGVCMAFWGDEMVYGFMRGCEGAMRGNKGF